MITTAAYIGYCQCRSGCGRILGALIDIHTSRPAPREQKMHADFDELLNAVISFAQFQLADGGAIYPFGASMTPDGKVGINAADAGRDKPPEPGTEVDLFADDDRPYPPTRYGWQDPRRLHLRADVFCVPPGKTAKTDAIGVLLEHDSPGDAIG